MHVFSIDKSYNSLLNTLSDSLTSNLDHKRAPITLIAKGRPLHFSTIRLPISSSYEYASKLPSWKAYFANSGQQSPFDHSIIWWVVLACMTLATSESRVVTMTLLPCVLYLKALLKISHLEVECSVLSRNPFPNKKTSKTCFRQVLRS
jgi:hypothetical protein